MFIPREVLSRCVPFALYMLIMASSPVIAELAGLSQPQQNWLYALRVGAPLLAMLYFRRDYGELRAQRFGIGGLLAALVIAFDRFDVVGHLLEQVGDFGVLHHRSPSLR